MLIGERVCVKMIWAFEVAFLLESQTNPTKEYQQKTRRTLILFEQIGLKHVLKGWPQGRMAKGEALKAA